MATLLRVARDSSSPLLLEITDPQPLRDVLTPTLCIHQKLSPIMLNLFKLFKSNRRTIAKAVNRLERYGVHGIVQQQFATLLQTSQGRLLYHANPRFIAEQLELSERETLRVLVAALNEGIMTLHWEIQCPLCSGVDTTPKSLKDIHTQHVCPFCKATHQNSADDNVRVTFSVGQRLRKLNRSADDPAFRASVDENYGVVSGHRLLTIQLFRNLFPQETMPPYESLLIRRVAILFTDLAGSTALYSRQGDPRAYNLVRQHFDLLFDIVDRHQGVVVKTIGDAVMAAFTEPEDAVRAAITMQQEMQQLSQLLHLSKENQLILKVGVHAGPCINVTLNERVDYFGTMVNMAARVQALSQGHDVVITEELLATAKPIAAETDYLCHPDSAVLKGLSAPVAVYHLRSRSARPQVVR
jgi:class 3 adenylate cyclase